MSLDIVNMLPRIDNQIGIQEVHDFCHKKALVKGIQEDITLRLRYFCSSDDLYIAKSKEYTKYLAKRKHDLKSMQQFFNNVVKTSR